MFPTLQLIKKAKIKKKTADDGEIEVMAY